MRRRTPPSLAHTHTRMKELKTGTLESKKEVQNSNISHVKNMNKKKNRLTPVKIISKKQAKKVVDEREGLGWEVPTELLGSTDVPLTLHVFFSRELIFHDLKSVRHI